MAHPNVETTRRASGRKAKAAFASSPGAGPRASRARMRGAATGAAAIALLLGPPGDARADEYAAEYGWSDMTVRATTGDPARKTLVRGPIRTQRDWEHAVNAVQYGSADLLDTSIHTYGNDAYGVYYSGAARLFITGATITTRGERAHALGGFDERGDDIPDYGYADTGELRMASGTLIMEGNRSHGLHVAGRSGPIHLGRPMSQPLEAARVSRKDPQADVWIFGKGSHNTAIHVVANRAVTFNGVRAILYGPSSTGILAQENARISGKNLWLYSREADSVGLEANGRAPCTTDPQGSRCAAADTILRVTRGAVHMQGAHSPAVELRRARVLLRDVSLMTGPETPYAAGNEAGRFRFEGRAARAALRSHGSALRAWVRSADESAIFQLTRADVDSAADTLLDVVRLDGADPLRPGRNYYVMLKLDDTRANGSVHGLPQARAHIELANGSTWQGHTDIGGHIRIDRDSTWAMDGDSAIDAMTMSDRARLHFVGTQAGPGGAPRFHTLTVRDTLDGSGRFEMRTHLARGAADRLDILGAANGTYALLVTDHSAPGESLGPRAVPLVRARRGNASFALENAGQAVEVQGHRYTLNKTRTDSGFVWSLDREPDGNATDTPGDGGQPDPADQPKPDGTPDRGGDGAGDNGTPAHAGGEESRGNGNRGDEDGGKRNNNNNNNNNNNGDGDGDDSDAAAAFRFDADDNDIADPAPPRAIHTALVNNGGIASASALWTAALRPVEDRTQTLRSAGMADGAAAMPAAKGAGVWIRGIDTRQRLHQSDSGRYTQSLWGYTLGADRTLEVNAGRWHVGATVSQVEAHRRFDDGKGRSAAVLFGAYAVLQLENGAYASVAASAGRFRNSVQSRATDFDEAATGRFRQSGAGIAIAAGRRLDLARGWFVEPGAGLAYFGVGSARYGLSDGTAVHDRGGHSLQSKAGIRAGRAIALGNGGVATPYVRFSWLREFANRGAIHADGAALGTDLSGNRFEIGAGAEAQLGRRHFVYADVELGKGRHVSQSRAIVAGYQYRW